MIIHMKLWISLLGLVMSVSAMAQGTLRQGLEDSYSVWRKAMVSRDVEAWKRTTAEHRRVEIKNKVVSEKREFPRAVFDVPAPPPSLTGLKFLDANEKGRTAKALYYGKVDFGVGGSPSDNLLVLSFVKGGNAWLYDKADFVNLEALPEVRKELAAGDLKYLKETPECQATGVVPATPVEVSVAPYIAKVYVFCPGRQVQVQVNKISRHLFTNAKDSEVVIGGAKEGLNEVQYSLKPIEGGTGKEAMTVRVYLMSQVPGVQPIKIYENQVNEGQTPNPSGTGHFDVNAEVIKRLNGR